MSRARWWLAASCAVVVVVAVGLLIRGHRTRSEQAPDQHVGESPPAEVRAPPSPAWLISPDGQSGWMVLPKEPSWAADGIREGAVRKLTRLRDGRQATGQGGLVHLAITPAPIGKGIDELAADEEVRGFMLRRFSADPSAWPNVRTVADTWDGWREVRSLRAEGVSPNLDGTPGQTRAVMLLVIDDGWLYKFRMYAWRTEHDREGLKGDLDVIEMNFWIPRQEDDR